MKGLEAKDMKNVVTELNPQCFTVRHFWQSLKSFFLCVLKQYRTMTPQIMTGCMDLTCSLHCVGGSCVAAARTLSPSIVAQLGSSIIVGIAGFNSEGGVTRSSILLLGTLQIVARPLAVKYGKVKDFAQDAGDLGGVLIPIDTTIAAKPTMLVHESGFLTHDVSEDMRKVMDEHRIGHDSRINMLNISLNSLSDDMENKVSINEALAGRSDLTRHLTASHQQLE
jgi:hypothetical protein